MSTNNESKRQVSAEQFSEAAQVANTVVAEDGADLSCGQVIALGKENVALHIVHTTLSNLKTEADGELLKESIAPSTLMKLKLAIGNLDGHVTLVDLAIENKKGDVATIVNEHKVVKSEAAATAKVMETQLVVARSLAKAPDAD